MASQINRLINLLIKEIKEKKERIKQLTNEISEIEKTLPIAPKKIKECDDDGKGA